MTDRAFVRVAQKWWPGNPGAVHVFPRYHDDDLFRRHHQAQWVSTDEREPFARKLRDALHVPTAFESDSNVADAHAAGRI